MQPSAILQALDGRLLHLHFRASRAFSVEIAERPGQWLDPQALDVVAESCQSIVASCLNGRRLDYGLFSPDRQAWGRTVITLVRRATDGRPVAFNAMPMLPVVRGGETTNLLHLGLVMVDPAERSGGLSWILYGLTCFALFLRGGLRPLWISSVTQVPAVVGMVAETFDDVYPGKSGVGLSFAHRHIAHQIMALERSAFGVGEDAGFDPESHIITNAYTGGSNNLKKSFEVASKHRDDQYNRFCETNLDYQRGDDVLQIGRIDLATARRFLVRSVPPHAALQMAVQAIFLTFEAVIAPLMQWLDADHALGRLRPAR